MGPIERGAAGLCTTAERSASMGLRAVDSGVAHVSGGWGPNLDSSVPAASWRILT
jgi:hypothetical protein